MTRVHAPRQVNPGGQKIFKLMAPPPVGKTYYMMSEAEFVDTDKGFGLLPVHWNDDTHMGEDWAEVNSCVGSAQERIDTECLYGNTCQRIFFDYHGVPGCYPQQVAKLPTHLPAHAPRLVHLVVDPA